MGTYVRNSHRNVVGHYLHVIFQTLFHLMRSIISKFPEIFSDSPPFHAIIETNPHQKYGAWTTENSIAAEGARKGKEAGKSWWARSEESSSSCSYLAVFCV